LGVKPKSLTFYLRHQEIVRLFSFLVGIMSISHYYTIDNGGIDWTIAVWNCDECGSKIDDSWPKVARKTCHFCMPCAFKLGEITEDGYYGGRRFPDQHVEVFEGEVWEWVGKRAHLIGRQLIVGKQKIIKIGVHLFSLGTSSSVYRVDRSEEILRLIT
jgi:hypothetical protein